LDSGEKENIKMVEATVVHCVQLYIDLSKSDIITNPNWWNLKLRKFGVSSKDRISEELTKLLQLKNNWYDILTYHKPHTYKFYKWTHPRQRLYTTL